MSTTINRSKGATDGDFALRLAGLIKEFGSRYRLAKASGIPASTLQSYEAGSKPGSEALGRLARVANVDIGWLLTGTGPMRPAGALPGAALADVVMVFLWQMGSSLLTHPDGIIGEVPFSRRLLETQLRVRQPSSESLLTVEADLDLLPVRSRDMVLIDQNQAKPLRDGIYLLQIPGFALRRVFLEDPSTTKGPAITKGHPRTASDEPKAFGAAELAGAPPNTVVGRAIWIGRAL